MPCSLIQIQNFYLIHLIFQNHITKIMIINFKQTYKIYKTLMIIKYKKMPYKIKKAKD